jgi:hypothetical protein
MDEPDARAQGLYPRIITITETDLQKLQERASLVAQLEGWSITAAFVSGVLFAAMLFIILRLAFRVLLEC